MTEQAEPTRSDSLPPDYKPVTTASYDLCGNTIGRQFCHWVRMKTRIMGKYDTGPGAVCLAKLGVLHCIGAPLFRLRIWLRSQYGLKARLRALINKRPGR